MKTVAIIQARIGSSRLKNKMMLSLHGKPIIEWIIKRVKKSKNIDTLVVAIPKSKENNILEKYLKKLNVRVYRGSEKNVLKRFYEASKIYNCENIIRVCADNPLIDPKEIDNLINFFKNNPCDYAYNHIPKNNLYPDGLGAEIVSKKTLKNIYKNAKSKEHKEHCFSYIWDNKEKFNIKTFNPKDTKLQHPEMRFDIDTFEDYYKLNMLNININTSSKKLIKILGEDK